VPGRPGSTQQLPSVRTHVTPPHSPASLAPLPGPATVWRRENLGARCPPLPAHYATT
jgi:hypothetical protein